MTPNKLLVLLLLSASSLLADEPRKGTICFGTDCAPATGSTFEVKPADAERRFVWRSADASHVVLGTLAAKTATINLDSKEAGNITLSVRGDAKRQWPLETRFLLGQGKEQVWRWAVPAKLIGQPMSIRLPRGSYTLQIGAEHHKGDRRRVKVEASEVALHQITLAPLPAVTGRIVTMKKTGDDPEAREMPVFGAQLASAEGKHLGATNEQGAFRLELEEPLTEELVILSPGLGTRVVKLNILSVDTDLGTIALSRGVKLTTHIDRPDSVKSKVLHATLSEKSKTQYENTKIATRELKADDDVLVFADLTEGEYYLTLNGDGTLEHLTTVIPIKTEDVSNEIRIVPFRLQGSVKLGSEPIREGFVGVHDGFHTWEADTPIDGEGHFGGPMWQADLIVGWVNSKKTGALPVEQDPTLSGDPAIWDIAFKNRLISGKLFDDDTKAPLAHANLQLQVEKRDLSGRVMGRFYATVPVDDDGKYSIVATRDGAYDLSATAPDYVTARVTIDLSDGDESKTADFPMTHGVEQAIDFVWPGGDPVANAQALEGVSRDGHNASWFGSTDAAGRLTLRMRAGETKTLFVLPRQGSFAPVHVVAGDGKPVRIVVPDPTASLLINFHDADNKPALAPVAVRWNGEWLPGPVVSRLNIVRLGAGSLRYALLPAGSYEIWAVPGLPLFAPPPSEPVRVGLSSGEQTVEITIAN